ncbi:MAG: rRNA maturation RNase YbeY [Cytophagales bacterium]|nr:rRNA maturation RNase YbeY [Cytophagales bacterium]
MVKINFFSEDIQFDLPNKKKVIPWITKIIKNEGFSVNQLNFIFCSDNYLQKLNRKHLGHDTLTDVLTYNHAGMGKKEQGAKGKGQGARNAPGLPGTPCAIEGDIFISIDRVKENARHYDNSFPDELARVMIHGILHLLGYSDKTDKEKALMREKEDDCLSLRVFK